MVRRRRVPLTLRKTCRNIEFSLPKTDKLIAPAPSPGPDADLSRNLRVERNRSMGTWADARCTKYTPEKRRDWRARVGGRTCLKFNDDNKPYIRSGRYECRRLFAASKPTDPEQLAMRPLPATGPVAG